MKAYKHTITFELVTRQSKIDHILNYLNKYTHTSGASLYLEFGPQKTEALTLPDVELSPELKIQKCATSLVDKMLQRVRLTKGKEKNISRCRNMIKINGDIWRCVSFNIEDSNLKFHNYSHPSNPMIIPLSDPDIIQKGVDYLESI